MDIYHVLWLFWEKSNGARTIALNILLDKAHLCRKISGDCILGEFRVVTICSNVGTKRLQMSSRTAYSYTRKLRVIDGTMIFLCDILI